MAIKAVTKPTEDQVLIPTPAKVTLNDGTTYEIPAISWGREIRILRVIKTVLQAVFGEEAQPPRIPQITEGMSEAEQDRVRAEIAAINSRMTNHLLQVLLDTGPEQITEAASALFDQKPEWVEENVTIEGILEVLVPFLRNKQYTIMKVFNPFVTAQEPTKKN